MREESNRQSVDVIETPTNHRAFDGAHNRLGRSRIALLSALECNERCGPFSLWKTQHDVYHVSFVSGPPRIMTIQLRGWVAMTEEQFNTMMFHLRAMLGLVCLQAAILVGFAWKYL